MRYGQVLLVPFRPARGEPNSSRYTVRAPHSRVAGSKGGTATCCFQRKGRSEPPTLRMFQAMVACESPSARVIVFVNETPLIGALSVRTMVATSGPVAV